MFLFLQAKKTQVKLSNPSKQTVSTSAKNKDHQASQMYVENTEQITAKTPNKIGKKRRIDLRNSFIYINFAANLKKVNYGLL